VTSFAVEEWSVLLLNGSWIVTAGCAWLPLYCFLGLGLQFWAVVTQRFCANLGCAVCATAICSVEDAVINASVQVCLFYG